MVSAESLSTAMNGLPSVQINIMTAHHTLLEEL